MKVGGTEQLMMDGLGREVGVMGSKGKGGGRTYGWDARWRCSRCWRRGSLRPSRLCLPGLSLLRDERALLGVCEGRRQYPIWYEVLYRS